MTVTTSFEVQLLGNTAVRGLDGSDAIGAGPASVGLANGGFVTVMNDATASPGSRVLVQFSAADMSGTELIGVGGADPAIAALSTNGDAGLVTTSDDGHIEFRHMADPTHVVTLGVGSNADIATTYLPGFAAAWEAPLDNGYSNISLAISPHNDGSGVFTFALQTGAFRDHDPSLAWLSDSNFAVAWDRTDQNGNSAIWYAVYDSSGHQVTGPTLADSTGATNAHPSVAAYGAGFVITYDDSEAGSQIAIINRSSDGRNVTYQRVGDPNSPDYDSDTSSVGRLYATSNTHVILDSGGFDREHDVYLSLVDPNTGAVLSDPDSPFLIAEDASESSVAGLPGNPGRLLVSYYDEDDGSVRQQMTRIVEKQIGDASDQLIQGRHGVAESIDGAGGNDTLIASEGEDTLLGNTGDDIIIVDLSSEAPPAGRDSIIYDGGTGNDTLDLSSTFRDFVIDLSKTGPQDTALGLVTITGIENVIGSSARADNITGNDLANILDDGGEFDGVASKDTLAGGLGNDTYIVSETYDVVIETSASGGTDLVKSRASFVLPTNVENLTLLPEAGAAKGTGNELANVLTGNDSTNGLDGKAGADTMAGGLGGDFYYVDNPGDRVIEAAGGGLDRVMSTVTYTLPSQVEELELDGNGVIDGTGNTLDNLLIGNAKGNVLDGGAGVDTMLGGDGGDTYYVDNVGDVVTEQLNGGTDKVVSSITYKLGFNLEQLQLSGASAIDGTGNELANLLVGNAAANKLDGGAGADTMQGGGGNDTYYVDSAGDKVIEAKNAGTDSVHTKLASYTLTDNVERLYFDDTGAHTAKGNALSNLIYGNAGLDKFIIDAGGADTFSGGGGEDTFDARTATTGMTLRLDAQANNAGSVAGDIFASVEKFFGSDTAADQMTTGAARAKFFGYGGNDTLTGGSSVDALSGGAGNDKLVGNAGRDALDGGIGNDTMTGGADADTFNFVDAAFGKDVITDFEDGSDRLKVFSAVADNFNDFTVTGNGTHHVVLTLADATSNTITLDNASHNITITAADFLFY